RPAKAGAPTTPEDRLRREPRAGPSRAFQTHTARGRPAGWRGRRRAISFAVQRCSYKPRFFRRRLGGLGYRYLSIAILARIFRISARARNARTFTSGTDQPVSWAISLTGRSSISSNRSEERRV